MIRYLTGKAVEGLRQKIGEHLEWYYDPGNVESPIRLLQEEWRETRIEIESLAERLKIEGTKPSDNDAENALIMYEALSVLTPWQAIDERFWVWLTHFECAEYIAKRWLGSRPKDSKKAIKQVENHFFARDSRAMIRDNGVSRLWWLGYIAHKVYSDEPNLFLEIVLHRQDVRSALIERPSVSMNTEVLTGIFDVMREHWQDGGQQAPLFKREVFRAWMVSLNRRGGLVLMDALQKKPLMKLLRDEAEIALQQEG